MENFYGESLPFKFLRSRFLYVGFFYCIHIGIWHSWYIYSAVAYNRKRELWLHWLIATYRERAVSTHCFFHVFSSQYLTNFLMANMCEFSLIFFYLVAACLVLFWCISSIGERDSLKKIKAHQNGLVFLFDDSAFRFNSVCITFIYRLIVDKRC